MKVKTFLKLMRINLKWVRVKNKKKKYEVFS